MVQLSVNDKDLGKVIDQLGDGKYRIPEFQREFVWDRKDIVDLLDSIYQSYPVGSFFFWRVPESMWNFFRDIDELDQPPIDEIRDSEFPEVSFVLDGQQRLTSLYSTLYGLEYDNTDYNEIVFDLTDESFKISKKDSPTLVSLCDVWMDKREVRDKFERESSEYENFIECHDRLKEYKLPVVTVQTSDVDSVIDIFERINQQGTRLSRFDIVNANLWSQDFNLRVRIDEDLFPDLERNNFGKIERDRVIQTLALNIEGTCRTSAQRKLNSEDVQSEWEDTKDGIINAVNYLRNKHGVKRADFIPYAGMIPVLSHYMYQIGEQQPKAEHEEMIDRWFWRVAVSERYSSAGQTKMTKDSKLMTKIVEGKTVDISFTPKISKQKLMETNIKRSNAGLRNAFLCLLAKHQPRHFENGSTVDLTESYYTNYRLSNHHIFPNKYLLDRDYSKKDRKSVLDITFIPKETNERLCESTPEEFFGELKERKCDFDDIMGSHLIPCDDESGIWTNDYDLFKEQRAKLVYAELMNLIGEYSDLDTDLEKDLESAGDLLEKKVRDFIDQVLKENGVTKQYWDDLPDGLQTEIEDRIEDNKKGTLDSREKLDYCLVMEYAQIINSQWDVFDPYFESKREVENRFKQFNKLRRTVKHNRDVEPFVKMDAKVAIEWINTCINK